MKDVVILGAAYFGREVYSMVQDCIADGAKWRFKGFVDDRKNILDDFPHVGEMLGGVDVYEPGTDDVVIPALGNPSVRKKYVDVLLAKGAKFGTLVHPTAYVGVNVKIGDGCVVTQRAILTADIKIGNFVNVGVVTTLSHGNVVGDYSQFAGYCCVAGEVTIGEFVECGCAVSIVPRLTIGDHSQLCTGSVVLRNVKSYEKVLGNPARAIGRTDEGL